VISASRSASEDRPQKPVGVGSQGVTVARAGATSVRVRADGQGQWPGLRTVDLESHEWRGEGELRDRHYVAIDLHDRWRSANTGKATRALRGT
jgi:hypothetical protein